VTKKLAGKGMAGGVFLTVTRGDDSDRLGHGDDVLNDRREVGTAGRRGPLGRDDRAGLVRYADSSANLRVLLLTG
jgi:hypothetical protein